MATLLRRLPDGFTLALLATVALASLLPGRGALVPVLGDATALAVALLFFLHGVRLPREAIVGGLAHWRLHLAVLASSFVLFPLLGLALAPLAPRVLPPSLYLGLLFLTTLPSTVQASIAFTSIAGGNVAAALCSASLSSLLGTLVTPLLVGLMMRAHGGLSLNALGTVALQLVLPFLAGQALRPLIGGWIARRRALLGLVDRGSVLLMVYTTFSAAMVAGLWRQLPAGALAVTALVAGLLLAAVLGLTTALARLLGFARPDEITLVFCGSKKSLVAGIPLATVLFSSDQTGLIVLPLMVFHQIQLIVCAALARRYAARRPAARAAAALAQAAG